MRLTVSRTIDVSATAQGATFDWRFAGETEAITTFHVDLLASGGSENWGLKGSLDGIDYFPVALVNLATLASNAAIGGSGYSATLTHAPWPFFRLEAIQTSSTTSPTLKVWSHG
jgi:hypothetical protein